ncbi:MAG: hypothetical protein HS116_19585 [Planctomycetes bacterium]|nr:hypothetical protein [Planctomycetota bacterium]
MMAMTLIGMLVGIGFYAGFFFWGYWLIRLRLRRLAQSKYRGRPIVLFSYGLVGYLVITLGIGFLLGLLMYVLMSGSPGSMPWIILAIVGAGVCGTGGIGWIVLFFQHRSGKAERLSYAEAHPVPKLQLFMQDLFAAAFCFGVYMAFQSGFDDSLPGDAVAMLALAAWVILAMSCGLYFALDVCRRSLCVQQPIPRLALVVGTILFTTLTSLIPAWLGWRAWRYAMLKADWALGQDLEAQRQTAQANEEPMANTNPG